MSWNLPTITVRLDAGGRGAISINGVEVPGTFAIKVEHEVDKTDVPIVTIKLYGAVDVEVEGETRLLVVDPARAE